MSNSAADSGGLAALAKASIHASSAWGVHGVPPPPGALVAPTPATPPASAATADATTAPASRKRRASPKLSPDDQDAAQSNLTPANKRPKAMTPERIARLEARQARNRLSAQASRDKKKSYVSSLETQYNELNRQSLELRETNDQFWRKIQDYESRFHAIANLLQTPADDVQDQIRQVSAYLPSFMPGVVDPAATVASLGAAPAAPNAPQSPNVSVSSSSTLTTTSLTATTIKQEPEDKSTLPAAPSSTDQIASSPIASPATAVSTTTPPTPDKDVTPENEVQDAPQEEADAVATVSCESSELSARLPAAKAVPSSGRSSPGLTGTEATALAPRGVRASILDGA